MTIEEIETQSSTDYLQLKLKNIIEHHRQTIQLGHEHQHKINVLETELESLLQQHQALQIEHKILQGEQRQLEASIDTAIQKQGAMEEEMKTLQSKLDGYECAKILIEEDNKMLSMKINSLHALLPISPETPSAEKDGDTLNERSSKNVLDAMISLAGDDKTKSFQVIYTGARKSELGALFDEYSSDKDTNDPLNMIHNPFPWAPHTYAAFYEMILPPIKDSTKLVFECGIGTNDPSLLSSMGSKGHPGASLRAWRDFFPNAIVHGADIDRSCLFTEERITTHYVDQTDPYSIQRMWDNIGVSGFDLAIDDGLHTFEAGQCLLKESIGKLRPGGLYIIEDVKTLYWQEYWNLLKASDLNGYLIPLKPRVASKSYDNALVVIVNK